MADFDKFHLETIDVYDVARIDFLHIFDGKSAFFDFMTRDGKRKRRAVNRRAAEFGPEIAHAADVVFVSVSNKNSFDFFFILRKIGNVGYDDVDPGGVFRRERHTYIYDNDVFTVFQSGHIFADFADAAEEYYF